MDNRKWESGAAVTPPAAPVTPSSGYPTGGDPGMSVGATVPGAWWFHSLGEEMRAVLVAAGITPDTSNNAQLLEAIQRLIDAQSGNYALDTGAANAYVVALSPAITAYTGDFSGKMKVTNANTGASTLDAGGGAVALVNDVGGALVIGDLPAGCVVEYSYIAADNAAYITSMVPSQGTGTGGGVVYPQAPSGRLTLSSGIPVTVADVLAAANIYFTAGSASVFSGTEWESFILAELSVAVPNVANAAYDVYLSYDAGTPALALVAWANLATAPARGVQDGFLTKDADHTQLFLGAFRTTTVAGQVEDSVANRFLSNFYNRARKPMARYDTTSSWTYTTDVWRQMRADPNNQLNFFMCDARFAYARQRVNTSQSNSSITCRITVGLDTTSAAPARYTAITLAGGFVSCMLSEYSGTPAAGYHYLAAMENSVATGTTTWYGSVYHSLEGWADF